VKVVPVSAAKVNRWDAATKTLTLVLSHADSAVEVEISVQNPSEETRVRK
jgi:hypothetical protein